MTAAEQRTCALEKANQIRVARGEWRHEVRGLSRGEAIDRLLALFEVCPGWAATWPVDRALRCIPQVGPVQIRWILKGFIRYPSIGGMTDRERRIITDNLIALREPVVA